MINVISQENSHENFRIRFIGVGCAGWCGRTRERG
jgi:hypothetical protein